MKGHLGKYVGVVGLVMCMLFSMAPGMRVSAGEAEPFYRVMVNRAANCVTVYEKDAGGEFSVPVKAFVCSVGRQGHATPLGTFRTSDYYPWRMMVDGSYGQYAVRFNKGIMFHSVPYYTQDAGNMEWEQYNLLGEPASLGCVRLACADAKWIYENCARGTEVVVYDDAANPGPLGKPSELKLAEDSLIKQWDPTEMSAENPWNALRPRLYQINGGTDDVIWLLAGASPQDIYSVVGMTDAMGNVYNLGEYTVDMSGQYDLDTPGIYDVLVRGADMYGVRTEKRMLLCVAQIG